MFEELHVRSFGGGLDFQTHPAALRDDQWSWSHGWFTRLGAAEVGYAYTSLGIGPTLPAGYVWSGLLRASAAVEFSGELIGVAINPGDRKSVV